MTAPTRVQSPNKPIRKARIAAPRTACEVNMDLFEPFEYRDGKLTPKEVDRARTAIAACQACPRFRACAYETACVIDGTANRGVPPVAVVQAGVLFDDDSKPYGHTAKTKEPKQPNRKRSTGKTAPTNAPALELDLGLDPAMSEVADYVVARVNGTEVSWVPDIDLTPPRINQRGVHFALGTQALEQTVTRHRLNQKKRPFNPGAREILEAHDEQEVIRLGVERGMPLHRLAANLRTTWHRVDRICASLGIDPPHTR
ncbi:hypothetical protein [Dietzia sp. 179-F 9C3 NHS]|uniref:hypothetical protein n=1 Tax=Dietzia sp. 179-F 9C3 NHS TaxID=3374295 RepID=UPI0038790B99